MNRLWVRLTLAFIVVTQISIIVVALLAIASANQELDRYVVRREFSIPGESDDLVAFYEQNGNWNGVQSFFETLRQKSNVAPPDFHPPVVADARGIIVFDPSASANGSRIGTNLTPDEHGRAITIDDTNNETIGFLVPTAYSPFINGPPPRPREFRSPEQDFIDRQQSTLTLAAVVVGAFGLILGLILTRTMVAPLALLADAARAFAAHKWDQRVPVRGAKEIAEVALAFNEMADELQRAEIQRRNLIADIAHELRTPLTVMQGNLRALLDEVYPLEMGEIVTLYDETRLLSRLVDDLRELALADAGRISLDIKAVDLGELVRNTVANFAIVAESGDFELAIENTDLLPPIWADADRVAQILRNLLVNALRYTHGRITVSTAPVEQGHIVLSVTDSGEGILPEDLPHVFDRFYRGDRSRARASGGTGLGLAIARAWVEAMGGNIGVESTPGKGSRFWFSLPVAN
jgi:signal transduction histidine kinase